MVNASASPGAADGTARSERAPVQSLLFVLSVTAGCTDVISFFGLNGLFTAHITGNLVLLAAHIVAGDRAEIARMLSVPIFIVVCSLVTVFAGSLESSGRPSIRPLLLLQFLLLAAFLMVCVRVGPRTDLNAAVAILAGMLGVSAMAVQHTLVQFSIKGAPATAVMTSNVTRFAIDVGQMLRRHSPAEIAKARQQVRRTLPPIIGFATGCGVGAVCEGVVGLWAAALPAGLALIALAMEFTS